MKLIRCDRCRSEEDMLHRKHILEVAIQLNGVTFQAPSSLVRYDLCPDCRAALRTALLGAAEVFVGSGGQLPLTATTIQESSQ